MTGTDAPVIAHGTVSAYTGRRCRCEDCRAAWAEYRRDWLRTHPTVPAYAVHGTLSTYQNYLCRCEPCRGASRAYHRAYRAQRRTSALAPAGPG